MTVFICSLPEWLRVCLHSPIHLCLQEGLDRIHPSLETCILFQCLYQSLAHRAILHPRFVVKWIDPRKM